jgi:hypothetical protein
MPAGITKSGFCIWERKSKNRPEVVIFSLYGGTFNRLLTILLKKLLGGKAGVRFSDFVVLVQNAGTGSVAERVEEALHAIKEMDRDAIGAALPVPPPETWKFASVLPEDVQKDMALSDHYHVEEFLTTIRSAAVSTLFKSPLQTSDTGESEPAS